MFQHLGIRLALGGAPESVRGMVVRQSLQVIGLGLTFGVIGVLVGGRVIQALLYGLEPTDPVSVVLSGAALGAAAFFASWVPASRATRVDPMITMRGE